MKNAIEMVNCEVPLDIPIIFKRYATGRVGYEKLDDNDLFTRQWEQKYKSRFQKDARLCPVCGGIGDIPNYHIGVTTSSEALRKRCHGCNGKGWVKV